VAIRQVAVEGPRRQSRVLRTARLTVPESQASSREFRTRLRSAGSHGMLSCMRTNPFTCYAPTAVRNWRLFRVGPPQGLVLRTAIRRSARQAAWPSSSLVSTSLRESGRRPRRTRHDRETSCDLRRRGRQVSSRPQRLVCGCPRRPPGTTRDPVQRPIRGGRIYWAERKGSFVFASEAKAVLAVCPDRRENSILRDWDTSWTFPARLFQ